ncbi:hypothetical protein GU926_14320 [Nibribacter ruber]|uniref:Uncharacterized protein n=1 Tax=Nibribacter ruber TaxID=2698458 RepID=A0A6P1P2B2_9BACT|nr:hypothetical protein [Nibribacter ruber]QHL88546.1 hypothetical protein GU926_14320 [Nibribacter ruber]
MKQFESNILPFITDNTLVFSTSRKSKCSIEMDRFLREFRLIAAITTDYNSNQAYYFESNLDTNITMRIQLMNRTISCILAPNSYFEKHLTDIFLQQQDSLSLE